MGIATFTGVFDANNRYTYCGKINLLNALRRGNKHTGVLWLSAFLLKIELLTNSIKSWQEI